MEDWYEETKGEDQEYDPSQDPALLNEEAEMAAKLANEAAGKVVVIDAEDAEDVSDSDSESSASENESSNDRGPARIVKRAKNVLTPVEKASLSSRSLWFQCSFTNFRCRYRYMPLWLMFFVPTFDGRRCNA